MIKTSQDYDVVLTFKDMGLSKINELSKILTPLVRPDQFEIQVKDPAGGIHNIALNSGIRPTGEKCETCYYIDCRECGVFKSK